MGENNNAIKEKTSNRHEGHTARRDADPGICYEPD